MARIEAIQRSSALVLAAAGRHGPASLAEDWAEAARFELDHHSTARQLRLALRGVRERPRVDEACQVGLRGALSLVGTDRGNIQLRDRRTRSLVIASHQGFNAEFLDYFAVVDDEGSACGRAARQATQTVITDVYTDPGFTPHRDIAAASGFRAVCSTPLTDRKQTVVGVISTHYSHPYHPSKADLQALKYYGRLLGPILADLHEMRRLARLRDIADMPVSQGEDLDRRRTRHRGRAAIAAEEMADQADRMADHAERFASMIEQAASRGDTERRLRAAETERQIAAVLHRNAQALRRAGNAHMRLDPIPRLNPNPTGPFDHVSDRLAPSTHAEHYG